MAIGTARAWSLGVATSGVRPATRRDEDGVLTSTLVRIRTGRVVETGVNDPGMLRCAEVAAALPEIFEVPALAKSRVLGQIQATPHELQDLVLISPRWVHVLQKLPNDPETALVCVAKRDGSIGWIVSEARSRLERS